jgi:hypothetical protein
VTLPAFIFGSFFALLIGSLFHLLLGGDFKRLILYLITGWVGFWTGDFAGKQLGFMLAKVGVINLGFAIIGSLILLAVVYWLGMEPSEIINKKQ